MKHTVGIQGGKGSYHEMAANKLHDGRQLEYYETFPALFKALHAGEIKTALVAIANNRIGFIPEPYDELTGKGHDLTIISEVYVKVEHALLGMPDARLSDIAEVHSQAPALGQCSRFLASRLPEALLIEQHDTAGSAELIASLGDKTKAAIASTAAGKLYGLTAISTSVQDDPDNITRFIELKVGKPDITSTQANKTTMLLRTPQVAGSLVEALIPFREAGINLSSLQSRLIPNSAFNMSFFVEFDAGLYEQRTQKLLSQLLGKGYEADILGTYVRAVMPLNGNS